MSVFKSILMTCICSVGALTAMLTQVQAEENDSFYSVRYVVSTLPDAARFTDSNLLNPWGLIVDSEEKLIVVNNNTNLLTAYAQGGLPLDFQVVLDESPTGMVRNLSSNDFLISDDAAARAASFLFVTESGTILAYNREVSSTKALLVADRSARHAVYKGIALAINPKLPQHQLLYAADFHNASIDVFDDEFNFVTSFTDPTIPKGYAPFNIRNIDGKLYVTYAEQLPPQKEEDEPGEGNGFVNIFNPDGTLVKRLISRSELNSPWGLALAPKDFGKYSGALLVGNFGDGRILAYNLGNGKLIGEVSDGNGEPIVTEGLWALEFVLQKDLGGSTEPVLYFTAGPSDENGGLLGTIFAERKDRPRCHK